MTAIIKQQRKPSRANPTAYFGPRGPEPSKEQIRREFAEAVRNTGGKPKDEETEQ